MSNVNITTTENEREKPALSWDRLDSKWTKNKRQLIADIICLGRQMLFATLPRGGGLNRLPLPVTVRAVFHDYSEARLRYESWDLDSFVS